MYLLDVLDILQQVFLSETARHSFVVSQPSLGCRSLSRDERSSDHFRNTFLQVVAIFVAVFYGR